MRTKRMLWVGSLLGFMLLSARAHPPQKHQAGKDAMAAEVLDTRGSKGVEALLQVASKAATMKIGDVLEVRGDCYRFEEDIRVLCGRLGKTLLSVEQLWIPVLLNLVIIVLWGFMLLYMVIYKIMKKELF